jgi:hypothetical protein
MGEFYDADHDSAKKQAMKKFTLAQLQQDPNLLRGAVDDQQKKNKTERAHLKKQVALKQLQEKVGKEMGQKKDAKAMDIQTKMTNEQMQKQNKDKEQAKKEQGQTENPAQQV